MALIPTPSEDKRMILHIFDDYMAVSQFNYESCLILDLHVTLNRHHEKGLPGKVTLGCENINEIPLETGRYIPIYAIFGIFWFLKGPYLAVVTQAKKHATNPMAKSYRYIHRIEDIELIPIARFNNIQLSQEQLHDEEKYISLIHKMIQTKSFFFAYDFDLTHSMQRIHGLQKSTTSIAERADKRFCWNYPACSALIEKGYYDWITPIMQGHIEVVENCHVKDKTFDLLYVSRRSCRHQGCRFTMRGIDENGDVANFVETEQALSLKDGRKTSIVQIRGSIPLYWSSPVTMKYAPKVFQRNDSKKDQEAFEKHLLEVRELYGRLLIINLIDKKKEQLKLGNAFQEIVSKTVASSRQHMANTRYIWFDFHHECRKMQWHNLEKLVNQVSDDFQDHGFFSVDPQGVVQSTQSGVVRTNCMDNLDRTNVVQSLFGRRSLLLQLGEVEATHGNVLESPFRDFERIFKNVWGNNADAVSMLYAGTGALKTDFTRTGKRTKKGALQDGYNSCLRYILNNFYDGEKQDAMDLLLMKFIPRPDAPSPFSSMTDNVSGRRDDIKTWNEEDD